MLPTNSGEKHPEEDADHGGPVRRLHRAALRGVHQARGEGEGLQQHRGRGGRAVQEGAAPGGGRREVRGEAGQGCLRAVEAVAQVFTPDEDLHACLA